MATKEFPISWVGVYRATSNRYVDTNGSVIHAGGPYRENTYLGIPSTVKDAIKTSKTPAKLKFKMYVTNAGEFDFGGHRETYNKASGTMPWYKYLGLHPIYSTGWRTTDLTSAFMNDYLKGNYHGIVIYGGSDKAEAHGKTGNSNQAVFVVEGDWNTPPKPPSSITNPKSSTVATGGVKVTWTAGSDSETATSQLRYELSYYDGSKWRETWTVGAGVLEYNYPVHDKPETSSARFRIRTIDAEGEKSDWVYSPYFTVTHNLPPSKPTNLTPSGGKIIDRGKVLRVTWKHNDDGVQAGFRVMWRTVSESGAKGAWNYIPSSTGFENSISQYYDFSPNTFPLGEIEWTVITKDQQGEVSPQANYERFYAGEASNAPIWLSPKNGDVINSSEIIAKWSSVDQREYEIELREGSNVLWSEKDASNKSTKVGYDLQNNKTYTLRLRTVNKYSGLWSSWSTITIKTQFIPPLKPSIEVVTVDDNGDSLDNIAVSWSSQIGGRNLILGTSGDDKTFNFSGWNHLIGHASEYGVKEICKGGTFTFSVDVTSHTVGSTDITMIFQVYREDGFLRQYYANTRLKPLEIGRIIGSANVPADDYVRATVSIRHYSGSDPQSAGTYANAKLEKGNKATDWTPAPEDGTITSHMQVFRREYNAAVTQPWQLIGDNLPPDSSMVDYSPASDQTYEYMVRAWGENDTYTDSDIVEGEIKLSYSFLQRALHPSDLIAINAEDREESFDFGGEMMVFANRKKPVFEHEIVELQTLPITFSVYSIEELRSVMEFIKRRETFLYRDNAGRRFYCVVRQPKIKDKSVSGFEIELTLSEVDFIEDN
jgi:hypothetical protein